VAGAEHASVAGGKSNAATGLYAAVSGGQGNHAAAQHAAVGGGQNNAARTGSYTTVGGGSGNTASGSAATVSGGSLNTASGAGESSPRFPRVDWVAVPEELRARRPNNRRDGRRGHVADCVRQLRHDLGRAVQ
jgi:hypothetical protein